MSDDEYDFDPWETSSGLPDRITVKVSNPHFGFDAQLQDGKACAFFMEGTIVGGEGEGDDFSQWFTVGRGWEAASKGQRLVPEDGKKRRLNNQANYAMLFKSLKDAAEKQDLVDAIRKRGNPFEAETWHDLELYLEREEFTRTINNEKSEGSRLNVARIEKLPGASETVTREPVVREVVALSPKVKVSLTKLAAKVKGDGGSHSLFAEMAFSDVDGVLDDPAAEQAVMDTGDGSIWASA